MSSSSAVVSDRVGSLSYHKPDHPTLNAAAAPRPTRANCRWPKKKKKRQERPRYLSTDQPDTQSRSLLSRSRVNRAVEAARRVGGGLIVAALNVGGLRSGAGAPTDAGGQRPAGREGDRRAKQGGTPSQCADPRVQTTKPAEDTLS